MIRKVEKEQLIIDICNRALDQVGQGLNIKTLSESESRESQLCLRFFYPVLHALQENSDFSFMRKDEIITKDYLVYADDEKKNLAVSLPYKFTYSLPEDCLKILRLNPLRCNSLSETMNSKSQIPFDFRNYNNQKVFVTDQEPNFTIHYLAYVDDPNLFTPLFVKALEYSLASRLASALIKDLNGIQIGLNFEQLAFQVLEQAQARDLQQGAYSISNEYSITESLQSRL